MIVLHRYRLFIIWVIGQNAPFTELSKVAHEEGVLHCSKKVSKHLDGI